MRRLLSLTGIYCVSTSESRWCHHKKWLLKIFACHAFQLLVIVPELKDHRHFCCAGPFLSHLASLITLLSVPSFCHTLHQAPQPFFIPATMASPLDFEQQFRELETLFTQGRHSECVRQAKQNLLNNGFQHCATPMPPTLRIKTICIIVRSETD
jgi:hypothetical protein